MDLGPRQTIVIAILVLFLGKYLTSKIEFLREYNIPEPVSGGLIASTEMFGASAKAFVVTPLVGAFYRYLERIDHSVFSGLNSMTVTAMTSLKKEFFNELHIFL